ncbi:hypothetical protein CEXT_149951 [Caerostris extrusa]|uniref:Uncharacterized protein n=1 Tax=Caerostris extrusa TaxID=172846 RepID=A0AAV4NFP6_CAEEX|nr:hypothetical protein CEXT_149951 [Caerostris extrusa]
MHKIKPLNKHRDPFTILCSNKVIYSRPSGTFQMAQQRSFYIRAPSTTLSLCPQSQLWVTLASDLKWHHAPERQNLCLSKGADSDQGLLIGDVIIASPT